MVGLSVGFLGLIVHSLLSIDQARRKLKKQRKRYTPINYLEEHGYAVGAAVLLLIITYFCCINHVQGILEGWLPLNLSTMLHEAENYRPLWFLWGVALPVGTKWIMTYLETKGHV